MNTSNCISMLLGFGLCCSSLADTINVPTDVPNIQSALILANPGDKVSMAAGIYFVTDLNAAGKAIVISGAVDAQGNPAVTLDANQGGRVLLAISGEGADTVFENLIVKRGTAAEGAGMLISGSSPTLRNCHFKDNESTYNGGAVHVNGASSPSFDGCDFSDNLAYSGGAIDGVEGTMLTIDDCTFTHNSANWGGGAVMSFGGNAMLTNCVFQENHVNTNGGAFYNYMGSPSLSNCSFYKNVSEESGGAVYLHSATATLSMCSFTENQSIDGGALLGYQSDSVVSSCLFHENAAGLHGGAVSNRYGNTGMTYSNCVFTDNTSGQLGGGMWNQDTSPNLLSCSFEGNHADSTGGGLMNSNASPAITLCMFKDNTADVLGGGVANWYSSNPVISESILCGNTPDQILGTWTDAGDNVVEDECSAEGVIAPCCVATGCAQTTAQMCLELGGIWLTEDSSCDDCPELCFTDFNGDGATDIYDLMMMIGAWGACP